MLRTSSCIFDDGEYDEMMLEDDKSLVCKISLVKNNELSMIGSMAYKVPITAHRDNTLNNTILRGGRRYL